MAFIEAKVRKHQLEVRTFEERRFGQSIIRGGERTNGDLRSTSKEGV